jgi:hypothetical protein
MIQTPRIMIGAIVAGVVSFIILYVVLALGLVFALSLLQEYTGARWIEGTFKLLGLLALLFPGYAAARIAGRDGVWHGLLTGAAASAVSALFLMLTFSWEGSYREAVWFAIIKVTALGLVLGSLGGLLGDWRTRTGK